MSKRVKYILIALAVFGLAAVLIYQIPSVNAALSWRVEKFFIYEKNVFDPIGPAPTPMPVTRAPSTPTQIPTVTTSTSVVELQPTLTPMPTFAPLPAQALIKAPPYEKQTPNNCGPATLSMALHLYGWDGNQGNIAGMIKPVLQDRNVNPEELQYYVLNEAGWLNMIYRVHGDIQTLKRLLAANYPVIIEGTTSLDPNDALGPQDDLWAAHYLLLTGYDDSTQTFTVQDSYHGADMSVSYAQVQSEWEPFNNLYMVIFFPQDEDEVKTLLASDWDPDMNRQNALTASQDAASRDPSDAFAWFNIGSNLVYFERYDEAALAYDKARELGLPLRMFRYQFGPFISYFHSGRIDELLALTEYARGVTDMSEETWLWYGYALYRKGDYDGALAAWRRADKINPRFYDDQAKKAISLVQ